jgi:hypothetical protein
MTPGFIDLSFVNRGYEKTEPLMMPKGYHLYAYFRSEAEDSIDAVTNPYNIYSGRGADDLTSMMSNLKDRYEANNALAKMFMRQLRKGEPKAQEPHDPELALGDELLVDNSTANNAQAANLSL